MYRYGDGEGSFLSKYKLYIGIGGFILTSLLVWGIASWVVGLSTPKSENPSSVVTKGSATVDSYKSVDLLTKDDSLKSYEERRDDYFSSISSFLTFYGVSTDSLSIKEVYSASSYYVVVETEGGDYFTLNPNGSVVGYFSKSLNSSNASVFKGFNLVQDSSMELLGVYSPNASVSIEYSEYESGHTGYELKDYPLNLEFISSVSDFTPVEYVTIETTDSRTPTKFLLYKSEGDSGTTYVLVSRSGLVTGLSASDEWKAEVFKRAGSGTSVKVEGVDLWVYMGM